MTDEAEALSMLVGTGIMTRETAMQLVEKLNRPEAEEAANGQETPQEEG